MTTVATKYWYDGLPVPGLGQTTVGASKYWYDGLPFEVLEGGGGGPPIPTPAAGDGIISLTGGIRVTMNDTSVPYGLYAADGSLRITVVTGSSYTGLYAADGSINVVNQEGSLYHPCGAIRGRAALTTYTGRYSPSGAVYMDGLA